MRIKIAREIRREVMSKATRVERYMVMMRDIARCRSPKRAYSWVLEILERDLKSQESDFNKEELSVIKNEYERVLKLTPEELYEELKITP